MFGPSRRVARRTARRTSRRQAYFQNQYGGYDEPEYAEPQYQPPPQAPAQPDYTEELTKLAALKEQGVIDEQEFEAKKKQILGL